MKGTNLLTNEALSKIPKLYTQEYKGEEAILFVKFIHPDISWEWYAMEFDGTDVFFGYVKGLETELGYFSLKELSEVTGPGGLKIERDLHFTPEPLSELRKLHS